jgi:GNAT superfamily N-acetyltransferase
MLECEFMAGKVITYHLEMNEPGMLKPARRSVEGLYVVQAQIPLPALNRFLYQAVGSDWAWVDRLVWTDEQWEAWVDRPQLATWVAYLHGTPAGYFELEMQADNSVEIAYFGLLPQFIGQGIGGILLTRAIECAWGMGAERVWVHTCSLDHPQALNNYQARGLRIFKTDIG